MGKIFAEDLKLVPDCELIGYFSSKKNHSMLLNQLLECADIIYIATPHHLHAYYTKIALETGCHVLCEKPIALDVASAQELFELAKLKGLLVMEGMWMKFLPIFQRLKSEVAKIGAINAIQANFSFTGNREESSRLTRPEYGGGAIYDVGIYPITLVDYLVKGYSVIAGSVATEHNGVDLSTHLAFSAPNFIGQISSSYGFTLPGHATIWGAFGIIEFEPPFWKSDLLTIKLLGHDEYKVYAPYKGQGYVHEIESFVECIHANSLENHIHTHEDCLRVLNILESNSPLSRDL